MLPAKRFGVYVPQYFIGFGPTLWSVKRGDTEYGVKLLPLGGFVRLAGMFPPKNKTASATKSQGTWFANVAEDARSYSQQEIPEESRHRPFYSLSTPQKLAVMFGGPVVNLILAVMLFAIVITGFGTATLTNKLGTVAECAAADDRDCAADDPPSPALTAGFQPGDRIVSWGGTPIDEWEDITAAIAVGETSPVQVEVERGGNPVTLTVTPEIRQRPVVEDNEPVLDADGEVITEAAPYVGIGPSIELVPQP